MGILLLLCINSKMCNNPNKDVLMTEEEKIEILRRAKCFFRKKIAYNHLANTKKLHNIKNLNINPFTVKYLAQFAFGSSSSESIAKALLYPRILGTSIATTFGTQTQAFCNEVLQSRPSLASGMDIEFIDAIDGRKKYCQVKAGPTTINSGDVKTIHDHFVAIKNLGRTNHLHISDEDLVVGVLYGSREGASLFYKKLAETYTLLVGKDFWLHLTGDELFYENLIDAFSEVAEEIDAKKEVDALIQSIAETIEENGLSLY